MIDDEHVEPIKPSAVSTEKAYILFYVKRQKKDSKTDADDLEPKTK